jgi:hypothetical protein
LNAPAAALESRDAGAKSNLGPPRVPFVLAVGVTGHRADALAKDDVPLLRDRIREVLQQVERAGLVIREGSGDTFAELPPRLRFISPVADGADQIAADVALDLGWELQAILPFERTHYRASLGSAEARGQLDALLDHATCLLELPGDPSETLDAYVMTGRATVAHCDVLIAVWDGLPPRGRGGTGEVVQLALTRGTAIVHVPLAAGAETRVLWSGFDPAVLTVADDPRVARPLDSENVDALVRGLLLPPPDEQEQHFLRRFLRERLQRVRTRIEYSLLLTATGVRRFRRQDLSSGHAEAQIRDEWRRYRADCLDRHKIQAPIDLLEEAYRCADQIATHFAHTYRSGHIFNFLLGGVAVCLGLSGFIAPSLKFEWAALELLITLAIILNAVIGQRNEWHRRWLDYRQLAERLRPMRSLKLLGIAAPDPPGTATNPVPRRWVDWYAGGIWRAMGCPSGVIDRECAALLGRAIADHEVEPQVRYHERNSKQIELLDHRLGQIGFVLFAATVAVSIATLVGIALGADFVNRYGHWFTLVSAGFPALGTAVFGIRFQGDFGGDALRSMSTANTLRRLDAELREDVTLSRAADLAEQASRIMLSDLDEWRLVNQQRDLSLG